MFSKLLSLGALLVGSSLAVYPPAYLSASSAWGNGCEDCGYGQSSASVSPIQET